MKIFSIFLFTALLLVPQTHKAAEASHIVLAACHKTADDAMDVDAQRPTTPTKDHGTSAETMAAHKPESCSNLETFIQAVMKGSVPDEILRKTRLNVTLGGEGETPRLQLANPDLVSHYKLGQDAGTTQDINATLLQPTFQIALLTFLCREEQHLARFTAYNAPDITPQEKKQFEAKSWGFLNRMALTTLKEFTSHSLFGHKDHVQGACTLWHMINPNRMVQDKKEHPHYLELHKKLTALTLQQSSQ